MLLEMREQYGEILLKRWNITFRYRPIRAAVRFSGSGCHAGNLPLVRRSRSVCTTTAHSRHTRMWEMWFWSFMSIKRGNVFKRRPEHSLPFGMGSTLRRFVCAFGLNRPLFASVQWYQRDAGQWERTNKHTLPLSSSFSYWSYHTNTHSGSHRNVVMYCWGAIPLRFTSSPWNAGTSDLRSAKQTWGLLKGGRVVRKPEALERPPMGRLEVNVCVSERERWSWGNVCF